MATKKQNASETDEFRVEYDLDALGPGVRGKYYQRAKAGSNVVLLDPDVARAFPTAEAVNDALRLLVRVAETSATKGRGSGRP